MLSKQPNPMGSDDRYLLQYPRSPILLFCQLEHGSFS